MKQTETVVKGADDLKLQPSISNAVGQGLSNQVAFKIREVDGNLDDATTLARLHLALVGYGPVAGLGRGFLARFCYSKLVKEGLMRAAIAEVAGEAAGLVAYTARAATFHHKAIRSYPFSAALSLCLSVITDPRVILGVFKALRLMFARQSDADRLIADPCAEILTFGVLPAYRDREFVRATGLKISERLVQHAVDYFQGIGLTEVQAVVYATNRPTLMFYRMLGASIESFVQAGIQSRLIRLPIAPQSGAVTRP
ncbi:MAG: GNAT family N-acetyltransferase [Gammaproteobacteria bacterium]|nr:GNAT family N-acetyltransferase [Gammaproteobacteria bacterium]